jgi:hypothetical protein
VLTEIGAGRAVRVQPLAVMLHNTRYLPGEFLGVDIFFV